MSLEVLENYTQFIQIDTRTLIRDRANIRYANEENGEKYDILEWNGSSYLIIKTHDDIWTLKVI